MSPGPLEMKVSVIIAFYNKVEFLKYVLTGFEMQSFHDFEIVIADDGSNSSVVSEIEEMIQNSDLDIQHVWHEDKGWRKNIILNKAVMASRSDYLIFIDGDCVPHPEFVREHYQNRKPGRILGGRRMNISKSFTEKLNPEKIKVGAFQRYLPRAILESFSKKIKHPEKGIYLKNRWLRSKILKMNTSLKGCNFSMWKEDLLSINGFDDRYLAPNYGEDTDIELRALRKGLEIKSVKNIAVQYHLYHKKLSQNLRNNQSIYDYNVANNIIYTPFGIKKA